MKETGKVLGMGIVFALYCGYAFCWECDLAYSVKAERFFDLSQTVLDLKIIADRDISEIGFSLSREFR